MATLMEKKQEKRNKPVLNEAQDRERKGYTVSLKDNRSGAATIAQEQMRQLVCDGVREKSGNRFVDRRSSSREQKRLQLRIDDHLGHAMGEQIQRMKIRTVNKVSKVSGATHNKHVVATGAQADTAKAAYLHSTFVTSDNILTAAVDVDDHSFTEEQGVSSGRYDFNTNVVLSLWEKTAGPGSGNPVSKKIDGVSSPCCIGVKKGGDEKIKITHFRAI